MYKRQRLGTAYGETERDELARALLVPAPLDLRINPLVTDRAQAIDRLRESGEAEDALECYEGALSASGINDRSVALRAAIRRHNPQVPEQRQ